LGHKFGGRPLSKFLKIVLAAATVVIGVLALALEAIVVSFIYGAYAPDMLFNPVTRYLYPQRDLGHGAVVNLIPGLFSLGEARGEVLAQLKGAGFEDWDMPSQFQPQDVTDVLHRWAGHNFACGHEFFIYLGFGADEGLTKAENHIDGACL